VKWSAVTHVSRWNDQTRKAIHSVVREEPDEYRVFIDVDVLGWENTQELRAFLRSQNPSIQYSYMRKSSPYHHDDVARSVYQSYMTAKHKWVLNCDDDDLVVKGASEKLLALADEDVGAVYGSKIVVDGEARTYVKAWNGLCFYKPAIMTGSVILYNRDAVREVKPYLEVFRPRSHYPYEDYGYFWDYKLAYWLVRHGYRVRAARATTMIQHLNRDRCEHRQKLSFKWIEIVDRLHNIRRPLK